MSNIITNEDSAAVKALSRWHNIMDAAQGVFFTTIKSLLFGFGVASITILLGLCLVSLFFFATDFLGIGVLGDVTPATGYYGG